MPDDESCPSNYDTRYGPESWHPRCPTSALVDSATWWSWPSGILFLNLWYEFRKESDRVRIARKARTYEAKKPLVLACPTSRSPCPGAVPSGRIVLEAGPFMTSTIESQQYTNSGAGGIWGRERVRDPRCSRFLRRARRPHAKSNVKS